MRTKKKLEKYLRRSLDEKIKEAMCCRMDCEANTKPEPRSFNYEKSPEVYFCNSYGLFINKHGTVSDG
jgi:hypothetical protein